MKQSFLFLHRNFKNGYFVHKNYCKNRFIHSLDKKYFRDLTSSCFPIIVTIWNLSNESNFKKQLNWVYILCKWNRCWSHFFCFSWKKGSHEIITQVRNTPPTHLWNNKCKSKYDQLKIMIDHPLFMILHDWKWENQYEWTKRLVEFVNEIIYTLAGNPENPNIFLNFKTVI